MHSMNQITLHITMKNENGAIPHGIALWRLYIYQTTAIVDEPLVSRYTE